MVPILSVLVAILFGGMAVWFLRYRFDRKEPSTWFFLWLVAASAIYTFNAASYWVTSPTISQSFWIASSVSLSVTVFLIFGFARSFSVEADYTLLFWSVPLMFNVSMVIVNADSLFRRSGKAWIPQGYNAYVGVYIAIDTFYAVLAIYYAVMLYRALKSHDQKKDSGNARYVLEGLVLVFISAAIGGWLKTSVNAQIPVFEIGTVIGALLIMRGVAGPKVGFGTRKAQGEA